MSRRLRSTVEPLENRQLMAADLISINAAGTGPGNGDSSEASVSGDGRYVVFVSTSTDLVANDTNGKADIFLRDRVNNTTTLISKNPTSGALADAESLEPKINNDGTFVVFATRAANLIDGDSATSPLGHTDVVRYNISNGALELVSRRPVSTGVFPFGGSGEPNISADGRWVAFTSFAGNLGADDQNSANDVYLRDMTKTGPGSVVLVSKVGNNDSNVPGNAQSFDPQVSDDGRFVSFRSDASNLVTNDANNLRDTFVRDVQTGVTTLVSVSTAGVSGNAESQSNSISGDGTIVAFRSLASDLVANDTNNAEDIFLRNLTNNTTTLLSINRTGTASARGQSRFPWLSANGSTAVFSSSANDLISGDENNQEDIFLRDLRNGTIFFISTSAAGTTAGNGASFDPYTSRDGKFIVFTSEASDLSNVTDNNVKQDVFLQVATNNPGDPLDPDPDPTPGPGPSPTPTPTPPPTPTPTPTPTPPPDDPTQPDTTPPTVSLPGNQLAPEPGDLVYQFTVNIADGRALNFNDIGPVTVTKQGGSPMTATFVPPATPNGNTLGTVTYSLAFPAGLAPEDSGTYTVDLPVGSVKDAAGNEAPAATLGTFVLNVGSTSDPDLTAAVSAKLPTTTVIIGPKAKGTAKVTVTNIGQTAITKQNVPVTLYLSDNPTRDAADIALATQTKPLTLKTGKGKSLSFKFNYPANAGNGSYFLIAEADTGNTLREAKEKNNVAITTNAVTLGQPFIDLQPTVVARPLGTRARASTSINVQNLGNVAINQTVPVRITASTDSTPDAADTELFAGSVRMSIKAGATKAVRVSFPLTSLPAGTYFLVASIDPNDVIDETSVGGESNNIRASESFTLS